MGPTVMTSKEWVRSALSRAMLDTPRGRTEMGSFVAQVVIAAAELAAAALEESPIKKLFSETLTARSRQLTDDWVGSVRQHFVRVSDGRRWLDARW